MTTLYLASLLFGGVLIGASVLLGGDDLDADADIDVDVDGDFDLDADVDVDADIDVDGDLDLDGDVDHGHMGDALQHLDVDAGDAAIWMPFTSLRFWTFGTAAFGMVGLMLSFLITSTLLTAGFATVGGVGIGWGAAWTFRVLAQKPVSGETTTKRYVGQEAKVVLTIRPGKQGKIVVQTYQGRLDLTAETQDGRELKIGDKVLIASMRDGIANVTRLAPGGHALTGSESV